MGENSEYLLQVVQRHLSCVVFLFKVKRTVIKSILCTIVPHPETVVKSREAKEQDVTLADNFESTIKMDIFIYISYYR